MATSVPDDIYWIVSFNTPTMANGITSKFKTFFCCNNCNKFVNYSSGGNCPLYNLNQFRCRC